MSTYRISDTLSGIVESRISFEYKGFQVMVPSEGGDWKPLVPSHKKLNEQAWFTPFKFIDPNEINAKMGLPPNYVVINRNEKLLDWINKNFKVKSIDKNTTNDIIFDGEYIGEQK